MAVSTNQDPVGGRPPRRRLANAIRALAMDAVEAANSGHPGMPMGMADIAEVLWNDYLRFAPTEPHWHDRDRFVLSNGHGSMLLYAVAYLTGYELGHRRDQALPQARVALRRSSRARDRHRHRDDHGAARPRHRERGRHGARGALARDALQSRRRDGRRSLHLFLLRRRLPDGRRLARGVRVRGHAEARQADRLLRRQRHLDRRRGRGLVHGRHAEALRGLRLARRAARRRPRSARRFAPRSRRRGRRKAGRR